MKFSIGTILGKAIKRFEQQWPHLFIASLIMHAVSGISLVLGAGIIGILKDTSASALSLFILAYFPLFCAGLYLGWLVYVLALCRDTVPSYEVLFSRLFFIAPLYAFFGFLLYVILVTLGFICLIIPGILALSRFSLYMVVLADLDCGPIEALSRSNHITQGATGRILGLLALTSLLTIIPFIGPIIWTLVVVELYLTLEKSTKK